MREDSEVAPWARAEALMALGDAAKVERWLVRGRPAIAAPEGWRAELEGRGLWPWVPPEGAGPVLLVRGDVALDDRVAVVGSRASDPYGLAVARRVAEDAVAMGAAVVSGGAEGCDRAAHEAALEAGGRTLVVLGGGHARPYPAAHRPLFERVVEGGGALVSAYAPAVRPARYRFLARNRVIAALSQVTVVARAAAKSGSLSTAREARALGRAVLAVPGRVGEGLAGGVWAVLREGAGICADAGDLARALGRLGGGGARSWPIAHGGDAAPWSEQAPPAPLTVAEDASGSPVARALMAALADESGLDVDALVVRTGASVEGVVAALLDLELSGRVRRLPGDRYTARRP